MTSADDTQQATAHTPEPWQITGQSCRDYEGAEIGTGNKTVAVILTADTVEVTEEESANASRIIAAVNACQGISTDALENGVVKELITSSIKFSEALRNNFSDAQLCLEERDDWRDAIAKATGRAS